MSEGRELPPPWGPVALEPGEARRFVVGPFGLRVHRRPGEWNLAWWSSGDSLSRDLEIGEPEEPPEPPDDLPPKAKSARFATAGRDTGIALLPRLADRPIVVRPESPFHVFAGAEVNLFLSTPVWIGVVSDPGEIDLLDVPCARPSDTWFGDRGSPHGQLCYAGTTSARLDLSELPVRPARAVTKVTIVNAGMRVLEVDRLNLPVPNLEVYVSADGRLWTQDLRCTVGMAEVEIEIDLAHPPPDEAPDATRIGRARVPPVRSSFARALHQFLA